ncbi:MAG: glutamine--tRNA ligase/YqeY domain fusion protein [Gammaproteobacteria bacterium]|jgi:glutaminyl-tRNA synthetase|nr:glutamine--tRNA ligase/YqeY domain fusion protein [Gammaproteobacteria bacterium]MBT3723676.1 glutamine--tRNA ligase/YqeY domain fusion protein [Gammaproteobacteria bacterium]MBT4193999.1 glutamine--tRNA ligase/YqeY domain fusion protein [Gammaproteobacteria bacterium]MBT4448654.1 glutamine--tRNA ligase/YqeY domain fusion protein [Gammaproteobacteria bacterium]MBT4860459.1 glutamine--tRNA ligase/YqeY domain fusion protein [Gammaproteobacteria bacterium]
MTTESEEKISPPNFIRDIISKDISEKKHNSIITRFPPEPNGYLHVGHAKSICLNFGVAEDFKGVCNLRFDDTNPEKEEQEYIDSIRQDVEWLGFHWESNPSASNYFDQLYDYAVQLIKKGLAYVDSQNAEDMRHNRGTLTETGTNSPYRDRSIEENLQLFEDMKNDKFSDGEHALRAKIDMSSPNINMRDPVIYRIRHATHHNTGDKWCIYPMYDFTHCLSDAIEGITHSLCTLEFEDHRPLYDWFLDKLKTPCHPQQIEFARLQLKYTLTSKRKLNQLVQEKIVDAWDDPRMPTISGMRRRGYTAESIRAFSEIIGVTKKDSTIEMGVLENCLREDLNSKAARRMAVLNPVKVVIENYPEDQVEMVSGKNHPQNPDFGTREIPFSREIYIEQDDFMEDAPRKFFRLSPGREVRLRFAYYITCKEVVKNEDGSIQKIICTYDPESKGGSSPDGRKVKGTIHWVSVKHATTASVRVYDRLFNVVNPSKAEDVHLALNPDSLLTLNNAKLEPSIETTRQSLAYQFERLGYFIADTHSTMESPVFNRTMSLRDSWAKIEKEQSNT